jgi:hypothetical protein
MSRPTSPPFRVARRVAIAFTLGLTLAGAAISPASATELGVITREFGRNFPTYSSCIDVGASEAARQHADRWECYKQSSGKWTGYLYWYT